MENFLIFCVHVFIAAITTYLIYNKKLLKKKFSLYILNEVDLFVIFLFASIFPYTIAGIAFQTILIFKPTIFPYYSVLDYKYEGFIKIMHFINFIWFMWLLVKSNQTIAIFGRRIFQ